MSFTNGQLAQKISDLIDYWSSFNEEHANWLGGAVDGGPNLDGEYPLTDWNGNETLVKSPAKLQDDVDNITTGATAQANAAAASAAAAATSETNAAASASTATTQAGLADADRVAAELAETNATNASVTATTQANLATDRAGYAQEWAQTAYETPVSVAAGGDGATDFSALHWATVAENFAGSVDSGLYGQLAQDEDVTGTWRILTDAVNNDGLKFRNNNCTITVGNAGYEWSIKQGQPGNYDGYLLIHDTTTGGPKMFIAPGTNGSVGFDANLLVVDGNRIGSNTSSSLAFLMPFDGTRMRMSFRGPNPGDAEYRIESYTYGGSGLQGNTVALFKTDQTTYDSTFQVYGDILGVDGTFSGNVTGANLNVSNWDTAYGWGDHAAAGYASGVLANSTYLQGRNFADSASYDLIGINAADWIEFGHPSLNIQYDGALHKFSSVIEAFANVDIKSGNNLILGAATVTEAKVGNWDTAYGWGNHASAGYMTDLVNDTTPQLGGNLSVNGSYITETNHGRTGGQSLWGTASTTEAEWSALPAGVHHFARNTVQYAPVANYGYFTKVAQRDSGGAGWGGLWVGYSNAQNYIGRSTTGPITWERIITDYSTEFSNWNTAYGWGDHASGGYIKADGSVAYTGNQSMNGNYISNSTSYRVTAANGNGIGFWNGAASTYGIYMSQAGDVTYGGRVGGETTSDYNMYFEMNGGTNRGFVFETDGDLMFGINPSTGVRSSKDILLIDGANGNAYLEGEGLSEGKLRLRNNSNWGLIARGVGNTPYIGAYWGGSVYFTAFNDMSGTTLNTGKGSGGILMDVNFGNEEVNVYGDLNVSAGANGYLEVTGSGYVINPTGIRIGQYTSTIGYIQAPTNGKVVIWTDGTGQVAEFNDDQTSNFSGTVGVTGNVTATGGFYGDGFTTDNTSSSSRMGIGLYGSDFSDPTYGILFTGTSGYSTIGGVNGDWATFFNMNNTAGRGFIFNNRSESRGIFGIENTGEAFGKSISFMPNMANGSNFGADQIHCAPCVPGGSLNNNGSVQTGYLRINMPTEASSMMGGFTIRGYNYDSKGGWAVRVDFYEYTDGNGFVNEHARIIYGTPPFDIVRFGTATSAAGRYILCGTSTTSWAYAQIVITDFFAGYSGQDDHLVSGDWTVDISSSTPTGWAEESNDYVGGSVRWGKTQTGKNLGGEITISTSAASGGSDGDIHFKY